MKRLALAAAVIAVTGVVATGHAEEATTEVRASIAGVVDRDASPWAAVLSQALGNAVVGIVAFAIIESTPGAMERRKFKRSKR